MPTHYQLLGLSQDCSSQDVSHAVETFRNRLSSYAPGLEFTDAQLRDLYPSIWEACTVLSDEERRAEYDRSVIHPAVVTEEEIVQPPSSRLSEWLNYSGFILLMGVFILFLYFIAGYML